MKSTALVEASGEKVKAVWDRRLTVIFCDICIKEILNGNRPGTHFKKEGWIKIVKIFENETGKPYTLRQLKNRWDLLKKEWKLWKKLKEKDTGLGWDHMKGTIDASEDWWESRLKMVPEAQRFKSAGIDPEVEGKLDQMFRGIVATGDKAWAPSSGTLPSDFFEHGDNEILDEFGEENTMNDVHVSSQVGYDENNHSPGIQSEPIHVQQKRKTTETGTSNLKTGKKNSSNQVKGATRLSMQIDKLCSAADNMSHATSSLTPVTDPFGIPQAIKMLDELTEEIPKTSHLYFFALNLIKNKENRIVFLSISPDIRVWWLKMEMEASSRFSTLLGDSMNNINSSNDDERELNEISQHVQSFNRMSRTVFISLLRVLETRYNLQSSRNISTLEMLGIFLYILGIGASVSQSRERFQRSGGTISRYFTIMLEKVSQMAIDIIAPEDRYFSSTPEQIRLEDADFMEYEKNDGTYEDVDPRDLQDGDSDDDGEVNISSAHEMELMRDAIACSLMN
ncbi:hypothetical protein V6N12_053900 [Hibiscus sabdariffa]|uniref:Myb/SANT-like domain-containing protein n=1 Tax=Hibiscus sabdariffa TaxID=183260 RepID=A0ABR2D8X7_9ROSI